MKTFFKKAMKFLKKVLGISHSTHMAQGFFVLGFMFGGFIQDFLS